MSSPRNALGRGLGALIPAVPPASARATGPAPAGASPTEIPIARIDPNPEQPRRTFDADQLERLAESIRVHGVLQPVVVRRADSAGDRYELVVGERRWRASKQAGLDTIPAIVADIDPQDRLEVALVENVQRRDLNPIELGFAFRALADTGATQEEIGRRVGLERSTIANHLRLLELPRSVQEDVEAGRLTTGHAKALLQVTNLERRHQLRDRIVRDGLSVRAAEELARPAPKPAAKRRTPIAQDPNLQRLGDSLRERFQTRVRIQGTTARGRVEIEYYGAEDLQRISDLLHGKTGVD
ncbi:MAG: ParB/RepB/Spo0J family partition protein [Myxococcales bacterium]|nr:ParB/RepB/Spo0J family partition protein [Myxococcales bacterium]MDH5306136.1 ParB/RepB/Spo0J family partition protein [Myxococcales bacterium]MDH5565636.1 ParB/RepB/Spo0J family partition protein [Myxococcales bacterium]